MIPSIGNKIIKKGESYQLTFIGSSVYDTAASTGGACSIPTGTINNDIMFAVVCSNAAYSNSVPTGWTRVAQAMPVSLYYFELYYKVAAGEGASYTWGFAASQKIKVTIATYRNGFNTNNPISVISNTTYTTVDTNCPASMIITKVNSPLLYFANAYYTAAKTFTKPSIPNTTWVEDYDGGNLNSDFYTEICSMTAWTGNGATGTITAILNTSSVTAKHAFAVALNPWQ